MTVAERRAALLEWFYADEERNGWGTTDIAMGATRWPQPGLTFDQATLYPSDGAIAIPRAFRDLKALERNGQIARRQTSGKATWWYA